MSHPLPQAHRRRFPSSPPPVMTSIARCLLAVALLSTGCAAPMHPILTPPPASNALPLASPTLDVSLIPENTPVPEVVPAPTSSPGDAPRNLRGIWAQASSITTREKCAGTLDRAQRGGFDALFVNVFARGKAYYASRLVQESGAVAADFDPLAYLVPEAHRRGIQVHAWFVAGAVGEPAEGSILGEHPEWALVGPDGKIAPWLNFTRPDVRQLIVDLMVEVVAQYGVDGVHFDYTRYPGPEWGFDAYSLAEFTAETGYDLNQLRYRDLPAYGLFEGNPLILPLGAKVLARFSNGVPAVTRNHYGQGEAILLNWEAGLRTTAIGGEVLKRSLQHLSGAGGSVFIFRSATNAAEYGYAAQERDQAWLEELGWKAQVVDAAGLADLPPQGVLVLPGVYLFTKEEARLLAAYVHAGGGAIFIDGPSRSIQLKAIQSVTGMLARGLHFNERLLMLPAGTDALIPTSQRPTELAFYQDWDTRWTAYRQRGIDRLLEQAYQSIKTRYPTAVVSITITADQVRAQQDVMQNWPAWLAAGSIDLLIPRGYVEQAANLKPILAAWQPRMVQDNRILIGVIDYVDEDQPRAPKSADQLLAEIRMATEAGSHGFMVFDLDDSSPEQLQALAGYQLGLSEGVR